MSIIERKASERFIQAMGPMLTDENKMQKVMMFIQSMRHMEEDIPSMSFEDLDACIPLDVAFNKLRNNVQQSYESRQC